MMQKVFKYWYLGQEQQENQSYKRNRFTKERFRLIFVKEFITFQQVMSNQQESFQTQPTEIIVFQVDVYEVENINLVYAQINQFGHLEINCLKINFKNNPQSSPSCFLTSIQSFWAKSYESNADLPKRLFQMKKFSKLIEYFKDDKQRLIQTQTKIKNDKKKLLLNLWIPVTKNINDFVPLQLQQIDKGMIHYFFEAQKTAYQLVHKKILQILQQRNTKRQKQIQKQIIEQQGKQVWQQDEDKLQQGEMRQKDLIGSQRITELSQEGLLFKIGQGYSQQKRKQYQQHQQSGQDNDEECFPKDDQYFLADQQDRCDQFWPQSEKLLKDQYVEALEQRNQELMERILSLQLSLVKKNTQLEIYEDPFSDLQNLQDMIEKSCQSRLQNSYQAINSLMVLFKDLKKTLQSTNKNDLKADKTNDIEQSQEGEITQKKSIGKIFSDIETIFEQFY